MSLRRPSTCVLPVLGSLLGATSVLDAAPLGTSAERQVQIRSIDVEAGVLEVFNFGSGDIDLSGWRFCSHDFDQKFRYTDAGGLNGVTLEAGTSVFVHFNDDAPGGDPDRFNRTDLGNFATPLDADAYSIQLYFPPTSGGSIAFSNSSLIADHVQWNFVGGTIGDATARSQQAVNEGLWSAVNDFVTTAANTGRIELNDLSGDAAGSPSEYDVEASMTPGPVLYDETTDGDLSDDPDLPTALPFLAGSNTVAGSVAFSNEPDGDRDYITFTIKNGQELTELNLLVLTPDNLAFLAVNAGATSFLPSFQTSPNFLAGILFDASSLGGNLLVNLRDESQTTNSLNEARLGPGTYSLIMQQTSPLVQSYQFEFVIEEVSTAPCPWDCTPAPEGNGVVNIDDLLQVLNEFGGAGECDSTPDNGDGTFGNGIINIDDLLGVINNFGDCP